MTAHRPLIGITCASLPWPTGEKLQRSFVNAMYVDAVVNAGGVPFLLPLEAKPENAETLIAALNGLVLSGGEDVNPARYQQAPSGARDWNDARDAFELALITAADKKGIPILAICRGCQLVNVARGGTLVQDLPETADTIAHMPPEPRPPRSLRAHAVKVRDPALATMLGTNSLATNTFHHQAIDTLGKGLRRAAEAPDGVLEAYVADGPRWIVGVQWHPEGCASEPNSPDAKLFAALISATQQKH